MNPQALSLLVTLLEIGERAYIQIRDIIDREKAGDPMSDAELQALKADSDAAHKIIQSWTPSGA